MAIKYIYMDRLTKIQHFAKFEKPIGYKNINSSSPNSIKNISALPR